MQILAADKQHGTVRSQVGGETLQQHGGISAAFHDLFGVIEPPDPLADQAGVFTDGQHHVDRLGGDIIPHLQMGAGHIRPGIADITDHQDQLFREGFELGQGLAGLGDRIDRGVVAIIEDVDIAMADQIAGVIQQGKALLQPLPDRIELDLQQSRHRDRQQGIIDRAEP